MEAITEWNLKKLKQELAELETLIDQTKRFPLDPDMRWARKLFLYRMGCLRERLKQGERIQTVLHATARPEEAVP